MERQFKPKYSIAVSLAFLVILAAAFMPWGRISGVPHPLHLDVHTPSGEVQFGSLQITATVTAWNGNVNIFGLQVPNWFVLLVAGMVTIITWVTDLRIWKPPLIVTGAIVLLGLGHSGFALGVLIFSAQGSPGIGAILTVLAFIAMLVAVVMQARDPMKNLRRVSTAQV